MQPMVRYALPKLISLDRAGRKRETFWASHGEPLPTVNLHFPEWDPGWDRAKQQSGTLWFKCYPLNSVDFGERHSINSESAMWLSNSCLLLRAFHAPALYQNSPSLVSLGPHSHSTRAYVSVPLHRWESWVLIRHWPTQGHTANEWGTSNCESDPLWQPHPQSCSWPRCPPAFICCFIATCHHRTFSDDMEKLNRRALNHRTR